MVNIVTLWDPRSDTQDHTCAQTFFSSSLFLSIVLIFLLSLSSFLFSFFLFFFKLGSFSCFSFSYLFFFSSSWLGSFIFFSFFFFFFSFLFFFFTLVSFLLFLHTMMAEMAKGFDFSCDLRFNRVKVCFLGLELWILWGNFFWCFFLFLFSLYICKRI